MLNRLREIRQTKGLSQYKLAQQCGLYQHKIWLFEHGYCKPNAEDKKAIAEVLAVDVKDIFPEKG